MNIEELQTYCKSLPGTTESVKWENDLCFCIAEKMYAVVSLSGEDCLSFKTTEEQFEVLIASSHFESAPYLGRYKWVHTRDFKLIPDSELKAHIDSSYQLIRSKLPKAKLKKLESE
ncbi:MAG: MmcQ/YjbR family DNA-binding protein [Reichenbachiella sp.]|uniref:MmcQ/YjbR family DNA-binding protein n=1 Tax=Reichenbachiella sp. TaxID=2184521 RepID=UPI0032646F0B